VNVDELLHLFYYLKIVSEILSVSEDTAYTSLEVLRSVTGAQCRPSVESLHQLRSADIVLVAGQFVGAGKSTFIKGLETEGRVNVASWTNRDLRPNEIDGIDKCHRSLSAMATKAVEGFFLELEELRPGCFYATPAEFDFGKRYVKDVDLKGALRLRDFAPEMPVIVPLPPVYKLDRKQVTEWERRVVVRDGLSFAINVSVIDDLKNRLHGVVEEVDRIEEQGLLADPRTLLVVNNHLPQSLHTLNTFVMTGEKLDQTGLEDQ
jgi:guanylate kinase